MATNDSHEVDRVIEALLKIEEMPMGEYRKIERAKHLPRDKWTICELRLLIAANDKYLTGSDAIGGIRMTATESSLSSALSSLASGGTADSVAEKLRTAGCRGVLKECWACPVQEWLKREFATLDPITAGYQCSIGHIHCETPQPIMDFIFAFDRGEYPDLALPDEATEETAVTR